MPIDRRKSEAELDRRLRRDLLEALHVVRGDSPSGGVSGETLYRLARSNIDGRDFRDDDHALRLIQDLVNRGYVARTVGELRRGERFGLRHLVSVAITDKGSDLYEERRPVDALVWDERVC